VTNTSARSGSEVVQLYLERCTPGVRRPLRTLAAFEKIALAPGQRRVVQFMLAPRAFCHWDVQQKKWRAEPGEWNLVAGRSSRDLRAAARVELA
jgi:beta-glucosidase